MITNSYGPSRPPYTSPEWTMDIEISVQPHLDKHLRFFHIQIIEGNLFSKTFNGMNLFIII